MVQSKLIVRLLSHYHASSESIRAAGRAWYTDARATIRDLSRRYLVTEACAAGVVAATSPRVHWKHNIRIAHAVLGNYYQRGCFKASVAKAFAIAAGQRPLSVLKGDKVRAFYRALMGDWSAAVVDVWMLRAVGFVKSVTDKAYRTIATAIQLAAAKLGIPTAQFQAIAWTAIRGRAD